MGLHHRIVQLLVNGQGLLVVAPGLGEATGGAVHLTQVVEGERLHGAQAGLAGLLEELAQEGLGLGEVPSSLLHRGQPHEGVDHTILIPDGRSQGLGLVEKGFGTVETALLGQGQVAQVVGDEALAPLVTVGLDGLEGIQVAGLRSLQVAALLVQHGEVVQGPGGAVAISHGPEEEQGLLVLGLGFQGLVLALEVDAQGGMNPGFEGRLAEGLGQLQGLPARLGRGLPLASVPVAHGEVVQGLHLGDSVALGPGRPAGPVIDGFRRRIRQAAEAAGIAQHSRSIVRGRQGGCQEGRGRFLKVAAIHQLCSPGVVDQGGGRHIRQCRPDGAEGVHGLQEGVAGLPGQGQGDGGPVPGLLGLARVADPT